MADNHDIGLMAHLMRRAGFGATREELEERAAKGYEATVEELLNPETQEADDEDFMFRYMPGIEAPLAPPLAQSNWVYRMLTTKRPLQEKMVLFWHHVFATGNSKIDNPPELLEQISLFRRQGMGNFPELVVELAKNPAMIYWLDNCDNHNGAINENWGRELMELFSLGVGHYSEDDIKEASRAFTGWNIAPKLPRNPLGRFYWGFEFRPEDHDYGEKTFLGQTGNFDGADIVDIIVRQPACASFIARHLYNFFVADEVQVPSWNVTPPRDPAAIDALADSFVKSDYNVRSMLRTLFLADFFKNAQFAKVKSPAELVIGTVKTAADFTGPRPGLQDIAAECNYQGQELLNPPSVEGWHTGHEWIDSGALVRRVNFAADRLGNVELPGIRAIVERVRARGITAPSDVVGACLDLLGPMEAGEESQTELLAQAQEGGEFQWDSPEQVDASARRVGVILALIGASREYQFA